MKKAIFIIFLMAGVASAEGPLFQHKETEKQQEFENIYKDLRTKLSTVTASSFDVDCASVTCMGAAFNGANQLIQADSSGLVPNADIDGSSVTKQGNTFNGNNQLIQATSSGLVANADVDGSSVTKLGNGNLAFQGRTTNAFQPAFLAYNSATDSNVTGDGTAFTIDFDAEQYDVLGNFSADTFTAPVTGKYLLATGATLTTGAGYTCNFSIVTSNRRWTDEFGPSSTTGPTKTVIADMDSGDTAFVEIDCAGGTKDIDVYGTGATVNGVGEPTFFSGALLF